MLTALLARLFPRRTEQSRVDEASRAGYFAPEDARCPYVEIELIKAFNKGRREAEEDDDLAW